MVSASIDALLRVDLGAVGVQYIPVRTGFDGSYGR